MAGSNSIAQHGQNPLSIAGVGALQTITDLVPDLLWNNDIQGKILWFNKRWIEYTGDNLNKERDQLAFKGWQTIIHPDDFVAINEKWALSLGNDRILETQLRLRRADGVYRWHIARSVPMMDTVGQIVCWFGSATDIDDLKTTEQALSRSEERLRIALQSAEMIAWDWNVLLDELSWSENSSSFIDKKGSEKTSALLNRYVVSEDRQTLADSLDKAIKEAGVFQAEFRAIAGEKSENRWYYVYGRTVSRQNGQASRMAGVLYNITNRKLLEHQKDDFFSIASHELKTPVTSIKAYTEVLSEMAVDSYPQGAVLIDKLNKQVDRLSDLINNLLDTTKIYEGLLNLNPEHFDINELIEERAEDLQLLTSKHTIVLQLEKGIPPVFADKERIRQVLTNLISNAIKYSPGGGDILIRSEREGNELKVSVEDSGIGIPDELKTKVFDRFFRVKNPRVHSFPGMGLGLYITAGIVQQHGGRILVGNKEDRGSLIYFTLPLEG